MGSSGLDVPEPPRGAHIASQGAARIKVQMFPLAADRQRLEELCERMFNSTIPAEIALFRPAAPLVFCTVLTYEDMGELARWKAGVYSQHEIYFLVPLDRYRWNGRALEFVEHCVTTPYIFVDDATSAVVGRERYGFPKELCSFSSGRPELAVPWAPDATDYLTVQTWQPTRSGRQLRPLLRIAQNARTQDAGFDTAGGRVPIPSTLSRSDVLWWTQTVLGEIRARSRPGPANEVRGVIDELARNVRGGLSINAYNFRQIGHPKDPRQSSYQDLIGFNMKLRGVQNLRFFRERFGPAGGYSVLIQRLDILPIVDQLGLRLAERQRAADGGVVDVVHAIAPMYAQADVVLSSTEQLCWRNDQTGWNIGSRFVPASSPNPDPPAYNDYLGASSAVFLEEQDEPPVLDLRYMLLPAATAQVQAHIDEQIPEACPLRIRALTAEGWSPIRLLWSQSRQRPEAEAEHLVWMDGAYASISVPVEISHAGKKLRALLMLCDFADNPFAIQLNRTVYAVPTNQAVLSGPVSWGGALQPLAVEHVLRTSIMHRGPAEARVREGRMMDVVLDRRPNRPPIPDAPHMTLLRERFMPVITQIQAVVTIGGVPDPCDATKVVEQRVTLVDLRSDVVTPPSPCGGSATQWVRFARNETYPFVRSLGLWTAPDPALVLARDAFPAAPVDVVPSAATMESAEQVWLEDVHVLWRLRERRSARRKRR